MDSLETAYEELNKQQRDAVRQIAGPLLVIAGPGTGKTQLLALRAAEILKRDPTMLPGNILCLTFTDNAADNMRQRLIRYIGQDAYQVAIHTFNSFGNYVMNVYPEYFYEWRETRTADELSSHRILEDIMRRLPGSHALASRGQDGTFYSLKQIRNLIADSKKANLTPEDWRAILNQNMTVYTELTPLIREHWPDRISASSFPVLDKLIGEMARLKLDKPPAPETMPLKNIIITSLADAAVKSAAGDTRSTRPFSAWRAQWLEKNSQGHLAFKGEKHHQKLLAAADIYADYQQALQTGGMADFSDQISWVLRAIDRHDDLRLNLQERFNYIMVDEFQDTNRAQLMLVRSLTRAATEGESANIMAVGDDDQAIFRFQGADIGNVTLFKSQNPNFKQETLISNYRSSQEILDQARKIAGQINESLDNTGEVKKVLAAEKPQKGAGVVLNEFENESRHNGWIARQIRQMLDGGERGGKIAVLARERAQLDELVPYLRRLDIPIDYERRENVLDQPHVQLLLDMARLVSLIGTKQLEAADELLAKVLSEPMWGIPPKEIWQIARQAYKEKKFWLDVIFEQNDAQTRDAADFLVELAAKSQILPFEQILDKLIGVGPHGAQDEHDEPEQPDLSKDKYTSPFKDYFFRDQLLKDQTNDYLKLLSNLNVLRRHLRNYQTDEGRTLLIDDLVSFVDSYRRAGLYMLDSAPHCEDSEAVRLMTVHKAKGLEFDAIFITGLQESIWNKSGGSNSRFGYPANLQDIRPSPNQGDDALRLLYVAMTRAKKDLYINYYTAGEDGRAEQVFGPVLALQLKPAKPKDETDGLAVAEEYEQRWLKYHGSLSRTDMRACLKDTLDSYSLSATHLNNFTDVAAGGPLYFLTQNLLNFPSSKSPSSVYGSVMHDVIRSVHERVKAGRPLNIKSAVSRFEKQLAEQALSEPDKQRYLKKGAEALNIFLKEKAEEFTSSQTVEFDFRYQGVTVGQARLRGLIDRLDFLPDTKQIIVTDYKTGAAAGKWLLPRSAAEHQRIRLHRYRQQLLFYKILVDGSAEFGRRGWHAETGILNFVEPDSYGHLRTLELPYETAEIEAFKKLITAVWQHIQSLDFPDTSPYPRTAEGIIRFEQDLTNKMRR